jgi:hypothetical protein
MLFRYAIRAIERVSSICRRFRCRPLEPVNIAFSLWVHLFAGRFRWLIYGHRHWTVGNIQAARCSTRHEHHWPPDADDFTMSFTTMRAGAFQPSVCRTPAAALPFSRFQPTPSAEGDSATSSTAAGVGGRPALRRRRLLGRTMHALFEGRGPADRPLADY